MFYVQANVVVGPKRSKSGTMIDRDKRRRMKDGGSKCKSLLNRFFLAWVPAFFKRSLLVQYTSGMSITTQ